MTLDANDLLRQQGAKALQAAFDAAVPYLDAGEDRDETTERVHVRATEYQWRDPSTIPPRPWLYGPLLMRGMVSVTVAPGGLGKSSLAIAEALALVVGRPLLGEAASDRARVWYWNLEDPMDELARRIQAAGSHYGLTPNDLSGRLFVDSGMSNPLLTAHSRQNGFIIEPVFRDLGHELLKCRIDALIIDPFISSHGLDENDNVQIDRVVKRWGQLAHHTGSAIHLIHHTRKSDFEIHSESARGAKALVDAARMVRVLNRPRDEDLEKYGIEPSVAAFWTRRDKQNVSPRERQRTWYRMISVSLLNGDEADEVGVVERFEPDAENDALDAETVVKIQEALRAGDHAYHYSSADWAGHAVGDVLAVNVENKAEKRRIMSLIGSLIAQGYLARTKARHPRRRDDRPVVIVGQRTP